MTVAAYNGEIRVDGCLYFMIDHLWDRGVDTRACCCGHDVYPLTIVIWIETKGYFELISGKQIPRGRKFYKLNKKNGLYYIPEVSGKNGEITLLSKCERREGNMVDKDSDLVERKEVIADLAEILNNLNDDLKVDIDEAKESYHTEDLNKARIMAVNKYSHKLIAKKYKKYGGKD